LEKAIYVNLKISQPNTASISQTTPTLANYLLRTINDKDIHRQLWYQYCAAKSCEPLFLNAQMQLNMYYFVPFVRPCMHLNYW